MEKKTHELKEMLSRELVESQKYVKLVVNFHLFLIHLGKVCMHGVYTIFATHCYEHHDGVVYRRWENFIQYHFFKVLHNKNHVQLWAKLKLEHQECAKFGACMSLLSETIAQGYLVALLWQHICVSITLQKKVLVLERSFPS